jgi:nuclear transport factor 2 (NTF2) superfamily protein
MRRREASIDDVPIDESDLRVTPGEGELPTF